MSQPSVSTLLLFGATGDLAHRMLLPSLYGLHADGLLPAALHILGTARTPMDDDAFRAQASAALEEHLPAGFHDAATAADFVKRLSYVALDATDESHFQRLAERIESGGGLAIFLSTAPKLFEPIIDGLERAGLAGDDVRLALEKPLGSDLDSSREINDAVAKAFPEERIFRVDHYLGKETVQNLLALRFANSIFEPLWNAAHIDHVQVTVSETIGLEGRGGYYDGAGALRDMVQNHMLQLLALVAMEAPSDFGPNAIRDEKVKVLRALRPFTGATIADQLVLGQYDGYDAELGKTSGTETFAALKVQIDNWRWAGVPFYLRTGKRLAKRKTEIVIRFNCVPHSIFADKGARTEPNRLIISIQPEENIRLQLMVKTPGLDREGIRLREVPLDIGLANAFADHRRRIAYERLLLDLIEGQQTLFVRRDEVEAQWRFVDSARAAAAQAGMVALPYAPGGCGPEAANRLIADDGREWND